jgi:hypothetical protein
MLISATRFPIIPLLDNGPPRTHLLSGNRSSYNWGTYHHIQDSLNFWLGENVKYTENQTKENKADHMCTIKLAVIIFPANHLPCKARCALIADWVFSNLK